MSIYQNVTACLLSWQRPENMQRIVDSLSQYDYIDEIIIWNNNVNCNLKIIGKHVSIIQSASNLQTYGRYLAAYNAKNDIIYTQDDDWIVEDIPRICQAFKENPQCIAHGLHEQHFAINAGNIYETAQMSFVGWGAFYCKDWLQVFYDYIQKYGYDDVLKREADRIFSLLLNRKHTSLLTRLTELSGANDERALWRQSHHQDMATEAVRRTLELLGKEHLDPVSPVFKKQKSAA